LIIIDKARPFNSFNGCQSRHAIYFYIVHMQTRVPYLQQCSRVAASCELTAVRHDRSAGQRAQDLTPPLLRGSAAPARDVTRMAIVITTVTHDIPTTKRYAQLASAAKPGEPINVFLVVARLKTQRKLLEWKGFEQ
jgi:hypothetical protein